MKYKSKEIILAYFLQILFIFGTLLLNLMILEHGGIFGINLEEKNYESIIKTNIPISGILDRWESNESSVILIEESNMEIIVPKSKLPIGSQVNSWLQIEMENNEVKHIAIDYEKTKLEREKARQLSQCLIRLKQ